MSASVSVVGLGKLGLCLAAVLAEAGYQTIGVDVQEEVVVAVNSGESPIIEPGLSELVAKHGGRNLVATTRHGDAIERSDTTFILVATPSYTDGRFSNEYVEMALRSLGQALAKSNKRFHTFVISCTVMPGSTENVFIPLLEECSGRKVNEGFGICYNPEFVALGTVIRNFQEPDVIVIGENSGAVGDIVEAIHQRICRNRPEICRMSIISAEIAKISLNVFLTIKISFGNMLANLCEKIPGADVDQIARAIGSDRRVAPYYLRGGVAFGGPCFPRDTRAFMAMAGQYNYDASLVYAADLINKRQTELLLEKVVKEINENGKEEKIKVGILGLAFKSGTPVITESPAIRLIEALLERGYSVVVYDPLAIPYARRVFGERIEYAGSARECIYGARICVIVNTEEEYREAAESCGTGERKTLIDCWRFLRPNRLPGSVSYVALGRAAVKKDNSVSEVPRVNLLGVGVSVVNIETALEQIEHWIRYREQNYVVCAPVHGLMDCYRDSKLREIYNRAGLVLPDGMPVAWILRAMGHREVTRVAGPDLMTALCERSVTRGYKHFFYGGWPPDVVVRLAERLRERYRGIQIVGTYAPPFRPLRAEEDAEIIAKINAASPDVVWIGLGTSKEKYWAAAHMGRIKAPVLIGVGAAFDFHAGVKPRAPMWMQKAGLEWFFRLLLEPRRLGVRYLRDNPMFVLLILRELLSRKSSTF